MSEAQKTLGPLLVYSHWPVTLVVSALLPFLKTGFAHNFAICMFHDANDVKRSCLLQYMMITQDRMSLMGSDYNHAHILLLLLLLFQVRHFFKIYLLSQSVWGANFFLSPSNKIPFVLFLLKALCEEEVS